jgi:hypothetical protein
MPEWEAAVDLTSRDLRTGTIQLPGRVEDLPPAGDLAAIDTQDDTRYALQLEVPRELRGLGPYFEAHALRTNDAIGLVFRNDQLFLEAIRRQRRHVGTSTAAPRTAEEDPALAAEQLEVEAELAAGDHLVEPPSPGTDAETDAGISATEEQATVLQVTPEADDPFAGFAVAGDFEPFHESDELDISALDTDLPDHEPAARFEEIPGSRSMSSDSVLAEPAAAPAAQAGADDKGFGDEPIAEDLSGQPADAASEEVPAPGLPQAASDTTLSSYYTLAYRRPFSKHAVQSLPEPTMRVREVVPAVTHAGTAVVHPAAEPATPEASGSSEVASVAAQLDAYLGRPDLPAIIRVSLLAVELQVDADELAHAVAAHASQPDSRLSYVRPDYYLFKRSRD